MLLWFVSALLLTYNFPDIELTDLEIDAAGTVWLLPVSGQILIRLDTDGEQSRFDTGIAGVPSGLTVSPTGRWALSFLSPGMVCKFDQNDILLEKLTVSNPGDILFSGFSMWIIDNIHGNIVSAHGDVIARNCAGRDSRLCRAGAGQGIVSGPAGVFLIEAGEIPEMIAEHGSGCYTEDGILLLVDGTLFTPGGDILFTDLPHLRISASPHGETVILWGNADPVVLE